MKWKGDVPAEFTQGSQVTEVISMMGMPNTITWTVDEYDAPRKVAISGTGMAGVKVGIDLAVSPDGAGSRFDLTADFEGQMIVGALGKAIEKQGARRAREVARQLQVPAGLSMADEKFNPDGLGVWTDETRFEVTRERLAEYAAATNDPIERAPSAVRWRARCSRSCRSSSRCMEPALEVVPLNLMGKVLHGEQDFRFHRPIQPGETLVSRAKMTG